MLPVTRRKIAFTLMGVSFLWLATILTSTTLAASKPHSELRTPTRTSARTMSGTLAERLGWARKLIMLVGSGAIGTGVLVWYRRYSENISPASVPMEAIPSKKQYAHSPVILEPDRSPDPWAEQLTGSLIRPLWHRGGDGVKMAARRAAEKFDQLSASVPSSEAPSPNSGEPVSTPPTSAKSAVPAKLIATLGTGEIGQPMPSVKSPLAEEPESDAWANEAALPPSSVSRIYQENPGIGQERAVRGHDSAGFLPVDLYAHFSLHQGEKIVLTKPFSIPFLEEGVLGLTNQRLVAVVTRRTISINPPGIVTEQRRHKASLTQITRYKEISNPRIELLLPALVLVWFWWIGTTAAVVCGVTAFLWPRRHLSIEIRNSHRRSYPLTREEVQEVLQRLGSLRADAMAELKKSQQLVKEQQKKKSQ